MPDRSTADTAGTAETVGTAAASDITRQVDALLDRCREVFRMSRFEGLKNREIAARLGISETAVEKHLARAVGRLGEHLRRSCSFELSVAVLSCLLANYL